MHNRLELLATVLLLSASTCALADSTSAQCDVTHDGTTRSGQSGPCTFSQRQGNVDLRLANGDEYQLRSKGDHYRDQQDRKVLRHLRGEQQEFAWEGGRRIIVSFDKGRRPGAYDNLSSLNGMRATEGIDAMGERGFMNVDTITQPNTVYGIFYNPHTRECVQLTLADSRVVDARDIQTHPKCR